jgi:hypothetical protein
MRALVEIYLNPYEDWEFAQASTFVSAAEDIRREPQLVSLVYVVQV